MSTLRTLPFSEGQRCQPDPASEMIPPSTTPSDTAARARNNNPARQDMTVQQKMAIFIAFFLLSVNWSLTTHLGTKYLKKMESKEASSSLLILSEDGPQMEPQEGSHDLLLRGEDDEVDSLWMLFYFTMPLGVLAMVFLFHCLPVPQD